MTFKGTKQQHLAEIESLRRENARLQELISGAERSGEAEFCYRAVADSTHDWEYWINPDGTLRYFSPSCKGITGYTARDFFQNPDLLREIVLPEDRERWDLHCRERIAEPGGREIVFRIRRRGGAVRWIEHSCHPVKGSGGKFLGIRSVNRDITERKQSDGLLHRSRMELKRLSSRLLSVQEDERKKIARELHDSIGQTLSAIKFHIENVLRKKEDGSPPPPGQVLETVIPMIQNAIEEVRRIQMDLRPPILDDLGILPTISWFCREYQKIYTPIQIDARIQMEEREIPLPLKTVIYRILQEAMNNVAKYSRSDRVCLTLKKKKEGIELMVEDYGLGFDPEEILSGEREIRGFGLSSMRERAELAGGSFSVESERGHGTRVRAVWNVKEQYN